MANKFFSFLSPNEKDPHNLAQLQALLRLMPCAACLSDENGTILFANELLSAVSGFSRKELEGSNLSKYGLNVEEALALARKNGTEKILKEMVTKDIESVSVCLGASLPAGTPYMLLSFDVLPQYQQTLKEKQFLQAAVEHSPFAAAIQDRRGVCRLWNERAEKLFGVSAAQALGRGLLASLPAELTGALELLDKELACAKAPVSARQMTFKNAAGQEVTLSVTKTPLADSQGEISGFLTVFDDITASRAKEQELVGKGVLLQAIIDSVPLGIYARTAEGVMTFFNKQSQSVLGETDPKCVNTPHPQQDTSTVRHYAEREREILEEGKTRDYPHEIYVDRNGNEKIIHMIKIPLQHAGPEPLVLSIVEDVTGKVRQEREIVTANNFLSAILDNIPVGLYARTKTGRLLLQNKMCEKVFQTSASQLDERGCPPHETGEQVSRYLNREAQVLESGRSLRISEEPYVTPDGAKHVLNMVKVPVSDVQGNPEFVITLVEDITEAKKQADKLTEADNFRQVVLDNIPIAIYAYSADRSEYFSNKAANILFPGEEGQDQQDDEYAARENAVFVKGEVLDVPEEEYIRTDGKKLLLHLMKVPVYDGDGNPRMVVTIAEDITLRKEQEREVRNAKNFLQSVVDNLPIALSVKKYDGKYIVWNKKSENLFGVPASEVIGKDNYRRDITQEQAEFLRESDKRVFDSRRELDIAQELISTPTEGVKIMHTVKTPLFTEDAQPDCLLTVSEDVTVKTKMEKQIREAGEKNSLLVESAREGIVILEDYKIIYANRSAGRILGRESVEEIIGKDFLSFVCADHQIFAKDKFACVINGVEGASDPVSLRLTKKSGLTAEAEISALLSKYMGRRIVLVFLRDVTEQNKTMREVRGEREKFKNVFELGLMPAFVLNHKGYISVMNKAARELFHLSDADRNFYRNVYIRPALTLSVRRKLRRGEPAYMDYEFDFDRAARQFPGRVHGEGKMPLHVTLAPFNRRDAKDGSVEADYLVTLDRRERGGGIPPGSPRKKIPAAPAAALCAPLPPAQVFLPDTEPYAVCSPSFKITSCNDLFCALSRRTRDELKGRELAEILSGRGKAAFAQDLEDLTQTGELENKEYAVCSAKGENDVPVRLNARRLQNGNYVFSLRSMTYHNQLVQILQERSAQLSALLEATDGWVFSVQFESGRFGRVEQTNKRLPKELGYGYDEITALPFEKLFIAPDGKNEASARMQLDRAAKSLLQEGRASFGAPLFAKDGRRTEASVTLSALDVPGKSAVLALVSDLSGLIEKLGKDSKEALELRSMRRCLPGLYLKTDGDGTVLDVSSNLPYLPQTEAEQVFLGKTPQQYWPGDAASKELFAVKEALSVNVTTNFDFSWNVCGEERFFETMCVSIGNREEAVLWVKDVSDRRAHEDRIRRIYAISNENAGTLTEQVDRILDFGKRAFGADVGAVMRFNRSGGEELTVVYATPNPFHIERYMTFPVEECLFDVKDDNVVVFPDLRQTNCSRCIHKEKHFGSLIAAPLHVGGKVAGVLCFASAGARARFEEGSEELIGIMSRILSLRIELREASKTLGETSQSFIRTLEYVDLPAVVLDLKFRVKYANDVFLSFTGRRKETVENREFFDEFIRNAENGRLRFESAEKSASAHAFQIKLDLADEHGKYSAAEWDVFLMKDIRGEVEGYGLIGVRR